MYWYPNLNQEIWLGTCSGTPAHNVLMFCHTESCGTFGNYCFPNLCPFSTSGLRNYGKRVKEKLEEAVLGMKEPENRTKDYKSLFCSIFGSNSELELRSLNFLNKFLFIHQTTILHSFSLPRVSQFQKCQLPYWQ